MRRLSFFTGRVVRMPVRAEDVEAEAAALAAAGNKAGQHQRPVKKMDTRAAKRGGFAVWTDGRKKKHASPSRRWRLSIEQVVVLRKKPR
jgi:hypothetical protein